MSRTRMIVCGFTLVELLIVVAIIAILAAIAIPNFMEAQVRSKISRIKADFRSLGVAIESYHVDNNKYPPGRPGPLAYGGGLIERIYELSTPVAYISSTNIRDPFDPSINCYGEKERYNYNYLSFAPNSEWVKFQWSWAVPIAPFQGWLVESWGPDRRQDSVEWWILGMPAKGGTIDLIYDPTNGSRSRGDIARMGGDAPAFAAAVINR